jgi:hypothetical protein
MAPAASQVCLRQCFADLRDPRREHNRQHNLWDIIALTICAVIAGADAWTEVEDYGHTKLDFLETFLELPNGIPSHDTIGRVFALLDPTAFQHSFQRWMAALVEARRSDTPLTRRTARGPCTWSVLGPRRTT